ncbi:DMT family transporter [Hyphobacterium sp. CCMP332]|nr:DMT family transporter [Hyphobacterium sp. CCMP332]
MNKDYFKLHFIIFIWGFTAILGKLIEIPSIELVFYRTGIAAILLAMWFIFKKQLLLLKFRDILPLLFTGTIIAAHWIFFFLSARVSTVSVCLAGMATVTLFTAFLEPLFFKRRISFLEIFSGLTVILGLYIIFRFEFDHALGLSIALLSAFLAAIFSILNAFYTKKHDPYAITFYEMAGAALSIAIFFIPYTYFGIAPDGELQLNPTLMDWFYLLILSGVCTVYAFSVSVEIMKRLTPFTVNLAVNMEPIYGILLALLIFGESEKMSGEFYLGASLIIVTIIINPVIRYQQKKGRIRFPKF